MINEYKHRNPFLEKVTTISTYFCCRLFGEDAKKKLLRGFLKQLRWNVWKVSRKKKSENICDDIKWVETFKDFIYKDSLKNNFSYISILYESTTIFTIMLCHIIQIYIICSHVYIYSSFDIVYLYFYIYIYNKYLCVSVSLKTCRTYSLFKVY